MSGVPGGELAWDCKVSQRAVAVILARLTVLGAFSVLTGMIYACCAAWQLRRPVGNPKKLFRE